MKRFDLRGSGEEQITGILTKPAFDEVIVSEKVRERICCTFGEAISPLQLVERIVRDIRNQGDAAILEYTAKIDGVTLTAAGWKSQQEGKKTSHCGA